MAASWALFYHKFNPIGNNAIYLFLILGLFISNNGYRRRTLGMTFLSKYSVLSKERYLELTTLFKRDH